MAMVAKVDTSSLTNRPLGGIVYAYFMATHETTDAFPKPFHKGIEVEGEIKIYLHVWSKQNIFPDKASLNIRFLVDISHYRVCVMFIKTRATHSFDNI